jgi:hypothetical protein
MDLSLEVREAVIKVRNGVLKTLNLQVEFGTFIFRSLTLILHRVIIIKQVAVACTKVVTSSLLDSKTTFNFHQLLCKFAVRSRGTVAFTNLQKVGSRILEVQFVVVVTAQ